MNIQLARARHAHPRRHCARSASGLTFGHPTETILASGRRIPRTKGLAHRSSACAVLAESETSQRVLPGDIAELAQAKTADPH